MVCYKWCLKWRALVQLIEQRLSAPQITLYEYKLIQQLGTCYKLKRIDLHQHGPVEMKGVYYGGVKGINITGLALHVKKAF